LLPLPVGLPKLTILEDEQKSLASANRFAHEIFNIFQYPPGLLFDKLQGSNQNVSGF
jgi:hypothetical protein